MTVALPGAAGRSVARAARSEPLLAVGGVIVVTALVLAVVGPAIGPYDPQTATADVLAPPSARHLFGTDASGLDVFSRVIAAPRIDVLVALAATVLSLVLGSIAGLAIGMRRGWLSEAAMRVSDIVQAFPLFVFAMVLVIGAGRSLGALLIVIGLLNVPIFLRLMRSEVLALRDRSFVEAARASGASETRVALVHVLPNALGPALVQASVTLGFAIILTAGLSFIGAGVQPPTPEWGSMIASGASGIAVGDWWPSVLPGVAMSLTVFGFATVGEALGRRVRGAR